MWKWLQIPPLQLQEAAVAPSSALLQKRGAAVPAGFFLALSWFEAPFPPPNFAVDGWAASESMLWFINYSS